VLAAPWSHSPIDDCIVDAGWIGALWREFEANPDVSIVGGRVDLHSPQDRPISIRTVDERVRYTSVDHIYSLAMGANLALRRGVVDRIGGFDPAFGGSRGVIADDIEFIYRALKRGLGVVYTPDARVLHAHGRRTPEDVHAVGAAISAAAARSTASMCCAQTARSFATCGGSCARHAEKERPM
jgi:GT2 family glycosyltransferase